MDELQTCRYLQEVVVRGLRAGRAVEIEGLGTFHPDPELGVRFEPDAKSKVFIAHVKEDLTEGLALYDTLASFGFDPWIDTRKLLPGQNWPRAIEGAIETTDFFIACFSSRAVSKRGGFQAEIRYALDCARQLPLDEIFIVPVRLDPCTPPHAIQREIQHIDLFPDRSRGAAQLISMMRREIARRKRQRN